MAGGHFDRNFVIHAVIQAANHVPEAQGVHEQ